MACFHDACIVNKSVRIQHEKTTLTLSAIALVFSFTATSQAKVLMPDVVSPGVTVAELAEQKPIHWVSVEQIKNSLEGQAPMAVGFDIDDTVLFPVLVFIAVN